MTKEENPQNQERGFPSFLESANPALPTFPPHDYYCCTRFTAKQNHKTKIALLATFLTYPQISQRRHFVKTPRFEFTISTLPCTATGLIRHYQPLRPDLVSKFWCQVWCQIDRFFWFFGPRPSFKPFAVNNLHVLHFHGMEEVVGSIPTRSTKSLNGLAPICHFDPAILTCDFLPCCLFLPVFTAPSVTSSSAARLAGS
jgi:hypothetical protein